MDKAKPGHTVEFHGLKGAAHLNGTKGTLVKFLTKEGRWVVRCELDHKKVNAKPENLTLQRNPSRPVIGGDFTASQAARHFPQASPSLAFNPFATAPPPSFVGAGGPPNDAWAKGLSQADQYEWFSNCYQMRCDDDYQWGGCNLHGPYNPDATPQTIADDFLVFCLLAHKCKALPNNWDWVSFLKAAPQFVPYAFEKSDAKERWGSENVFEVQMGGRSLRYTGMQIYGSPVDQPGDSREHQAAERKVRSNRFDAQKQVGGVEAWATFLEDLGQSRRFIDLQPRPL